MTTSSAGIALGEPELNPRLAPLRDAALRLSRQSSHNERHVPGIAEIDAQTWRERNTGEDWLIWRARRCAARLLSMPIEVSEGELVVGRLVLVADRDLQEPGPETRSILDEIPTFPGSDCGHFNPDYEKVFGVGIGGILCEIDERRRVSGPEHRAFYDACEIALRSVSEYARRVGDACRSMSGGPELALICEKVATEPPSTFGEAIQLMFLLMVCLWFGEDHTLTTPGRMDQTLRRFYEADLAAGLITPRDAFDLICSLFIQCNMILGPGSAIAVMVGGRDGLGLDATSDLTYLCLQARQATGLAYPTVAVAWHEGTPSELMDFGCRMLSTGIGDPAFFNDELISQGLRDHGASEGDSYNYMNSTCVEIKVVGASNIWVTHPYLNLAQAVLDAMDRAESAPQAFSGFDELVKDVMRSRIANAAQNIDGIWQQRERFGGFPLASCFVSDCLERGLDFDRGGARYNWVENSFVGLANLVDGLRGIEHLVYETREHSIAELRDILKSDYAGHEALRQRIVRDIPSYGTDDDGADALAVDWSEFLQSETESHVAGLHRYVPGFFCWVMHGELGRVTGATPDGRKAGTALADGAGAAQGRETAGPTASILSTTKWSHRRVLGGLVHNIRFARSLLESESGLAAARSMIETYLRRGGFEIQVNVVGSETLRDAQAHPENYPDLVVRVAGYSDYFTHLSREVQEEVIARNEHESS